MTAAQFEMLETPEAEAILRWRFESLVNTGFDAGSALILASHLEVDVREAGLLLERGCPPDVAVQIVL